MQLRLVLALGLAFAANTPAAFAQDQQTFEVIMLADQANELLTLLDDDANFAAQGAIGVGDADGWQRYQAFSTPAHNLAWDFHNYSWDLSHNTPLIAVAQQFGMDKSQVRSLQLAFIRLKQPPFDLVDRYQAFLDLERQFEAAIEIRPPNPNDEPDQPGHWQCTAQWSMNGMWMQFTGDDAHSRNAAKASALAQCMQRFTKFCQLGSCQQVSTPRPRRR